MNYVQIFLDVVGALTTLCTSLALLFPKGSKVGYALAKVGTDLKGHTVQAEESADGK